MASLRSLLLPVASRGIPSRSSRSPRDLWLKGLVFKRTLWLFFWAFRWAFFFAAFFFTAVVIRFFLLAFFLAPFFTATACLHSKFDALRFQVRRSISNDFPIAPFTQLGTSSKHEIWQSHFSTIKNARRERSREIVRFQIISLRCR